MKKIKPPNVAGTFYPAEQDALRGAIERFMSEGEASATAPRALIVPHAGYIYSGSIAASAYRTVKKHGIERVLMLGPAHYWPLDGIAVPSYDFFRTPLGDVAIDRVAIDDALLLEGVNQVDEAFEREHSLEVQLPFSQQVMPEALVVPMLVGRSAAGLVTNVLEKLWLDEKCVIIISSDLSHFLDYEAASVCDRETAEAIKSLNGDALERDSACGRVPVQGLLGFAQKRGWKANLLDLRNSGDTAGDRSRVVGYAAFSFA